jgi:hypothetical protein
MTGPEHYAEATMILHNTEQGMSDSEASMAWIAVAQVHATLALAWATDRKISR